MNNTLTGKIFIIFSKTKVDFNYSSEKLLVVNNSTIWLGSVYIDIHY